MECRAYGICLDSQSRGYLGKDRKVSSAAGGNLSRMHKTQETAKESRLNFMYSHLRNRTLVIAGSSPAMRQIRKVLDIPKPGPAPAELAELAARSDPASLRLTDVTFNYSGATKPVLTGLTVEIPAGTVVGITGRSGCGKSTLGKLLNGDLSPVNGSI